MNFLMVMILAMLDGSAVAAMPKTEFVEKFKKMAPSTFCGESTYFQKCFTLEKDQCTKALNENIGECVTASEKDAPATLKAKEDGGELGKKIGTCLGEKLETSWQDKKKTLAECANPDAWKM